MENPTTREDTITPMFVERRCPSCDSDNSTVAIEIAVRDFARVNPTYDLDRLAELSIPLHTKCSLVRCNCCEFVYSKNRLNDESTTFLYEHVIDHEKSRAKTHGREKRQRLLDVWCRLFRYAMENRSQCELAVLDFGCGWGDFLSVAQAQGVTVCGLEADQQKLEWGRQQGLTVVSKQEDIDARGPFDIVYCDQVLEHLDTPAVTAERLFNCLKPGGVAFVAVPCCTEADVVETNMALRRGEPVSKDYNPWEHLNYFSPDSLVRMLQQAGFTILNLDISPVQRRWFQRLLKRDTPNVANRPRAASTSLFCRKPSQKAVQN